MTAEGVPEKIPLAGVGYIVVRDGKLLLIPRSIRHDGVRYPNDSKIVLQLLMGKRPAISGTPESSVPKNRYE